jgi:Fe-S-cluster containining protein
MLEGEWRRVKRSVGGRPPDYKPGSLRCPMLSVNGRCTVYSVRPFICRLWGTIETLACPEGCQPERWLSRTEAQEIFERLRAIAGPGTDGPVGQVNNLWESFALAEREERALKMEMIRQANLGGEL